MSATPTGIPIIDCPQCSHRHPVTRRHCPGCGLASLFGHEACDQRQDEEVLDGHAILPGL